MAIKEINLDAKIDNFSKANVRIAGKVYSIVIDDEMFKRLTELQTETSAYFTNLDDISNEEFIELGEKGRKEVVSNLFAELKSQMIATLDDLLGEGEGKRLYQRFGNKTVALSYLIEELRNIYTNSIKEKIEEEKKQDKRMKLYTKRNKKRK